MSAKLRKHVGALSMILALLVGGTYFYQVHQESDRAACQAQFNQAFSANLSIRSQLSGQRQDAEDALLTTVSVNVLHPATTAAGKLKQSQEFTQAFQTYEDATSAYNAQKAANPLPSIPSC